MDLSRSDAPRDPETHDLSRASFSLRPQPRREARRREVDTRPVCRVVPLKDREGVSVSLVRLLERTLPEIRFALRTASTAGPAPDWLWICGFEPDDVERVHALRSATASARLLVTGRHVDPGWRQALERVGVDLALPWPYPLQALREHLLAPV